MKSKDWTQAQLADACGIRQGNISHYMTGRQGPNAFQLHRLAASLGVTMEWLLTGDGPQASPPELRQPGKASTRKAIRDARAAIDRLESELDPQN